MGALFFGNHLGINSAISRSTYFNETWNRTLYKWSLLVPHPHTHLAVTGFLRFSTGNLVFQIGLTGLGQHTCETRLSCNTSFFFMSSEHHSMWNQGCFFFYCRPMWKQSVKTGLKRALYLYILFVSYYLLFSTDITDMIDWAC